MVNSPARALGVLPTTGASTSSTPAGSRSAVSSIAARPTVDMSISSAPGSMPDATPSGPNRTASSAPGSASIVITISRPRAASDGVGATSAPARARSSAFSRVRFQTARSWPAFSSRVAI